MFHVQGPLKQIQVHGSLAVVKNELNQLQHGINTMLKEAARCSLEMQDITNKKERQEDDNYDLLVTYQDNIKKFQIQTTYYTTLSQQNVQKEMESGDQRAEELEHARQAENAKHARQVENAKHAKQAALLKQQGGPSRFEIQQGTWTMWLCR